MRLKALLITILAAMLLLSGCAQSNGDAPAGMKLFSNEYVEYTAYVPESWIMSEPTATPYAYVSSTDASSVSIVASDLTADQMELTLDELWDGYVEDFEANMPDMKYVGEHPIKTTLDNVKANQYVYTATVAGIEYKYQQTLCVEGGTIYIITYTSTPELYDENIANVENILKTFKF